MAQPTAEVTKENLLKDFNVVIKDVEQLLKSINMDDHKAIGVRAKVSENLHIAKEQLRHIEEVALENTKAAARATGAYMHEHPWQAIGAAAGLAAVIGLVLNHRRNS